MSSVRMVEATLPPGFRFHPRDDELVCDYLIPKWNSTELESPILTQVDLNKCEPWDIPETACIGGKEWYFYSRRDRKYATGLRTNRATVTGYWKATGKDRAVVRKGRLVGMRKTLVFYQGRAPKGSKTEWVMHEFRVEGPFGPPKLTSPSKLQEDWVLCRVFYKNKDGSGKSSAENDSSNSVDETTGSGSSPMMDSYITFEQTQPNTDAYQQVPCFSMFSGNNNNQNISDPTNIVFPQSYEMEYPNKGTNMGGSISMAEENENKQRLSPGGGGGGGGCDKKVLESVLNQLTKMERCPTNNNSNTLNGSLNLAETPTSETYLSRLALHHPTMWTHF